jgi:hypothetical protein
MSGSEKSELFKVLTARRFLFWDKSEIDPARDGHVIAERILEFGTEEEFRALLACYGEHFVKKIIIESRILRPKTVNYFALHFNMKREDTRCFSDASRRIWQPF